MVRRSAELYPCASLADNLLLDFLNKARFPDAGLAAEENRLTLSFFGPLPAFPEQCHLLLADHQRNQAAAGGQLETAGDAAFVEHAINFMAPRCLSAFAAPCWCRRRTPGPACA